MNKNPSAISLTIGEVTKNVKVTPSGMPDSTNPMNIGTVEHDQKGERTPKIDAMKWAVNPLNLESMFFTFSGGK
jgi:hypothetical protein